MDVAVSLRAHCDAIDTDWAKVGGSVMKPYLNSAILYNGYSVTTILGCEYIICQTMSPFWYDTLCIPYTIRIGCIRVKRDKVL